MILIDASVWIDHLRNPVAQLADLTDNELALTHPVVIGELAMGSLKDRVAVLSNLDQLPKAIPASDTEVLTLVERKQLFAKGLGYADAHLLASTLLTESAKLWTFDRRLREAAERLGCAADLPSKQAN